MWRSWCQSHCQDGALELGGATRRSSVRRRRPRLGWSPRGGVSCSSATADRRASPPTALRAGRDLTTRFRHAGLVGQWPGLSRSGNRASKTEPAGSGPGIEPGRGRQVGTATSPIQRLHMERARVAASAGKAPRRALNWQSPDVIAKRRAGGGVSRPKETFGPSRHRGAFTTEEQRAAVRRTTLPTARRLLTTRANMGRSGGLSSRSSTGSTASNTGLISVRGSVRSAA